MLSNRISGWREAMPDQQTPVKVTCQSYPQADQPAYSD